MCNTMHLATSGTNGAANCLTFFKQLFTSRTKINFDLSCTFIV